MIKRSSNGRIIVKFTNSRAKLDHLLKPLFIWKGRGWRRWQQFYLNFFFQVCVIVSCFLLLIRFFTMVIEHSHISSWGQHFTYTRCYVLTRECISYSQIFFFFFSSYFINIHRMQFCRYDEHITVEENEIEIAKRRRSIEIAWFVFECEL